MHLLITQDEIEALPKDPRERFVGIEGICRRRYLDRIRAEDDWATIQDAQRRYMGAVLAAAKSCKIEPISEMELPRFQSWDSSAFQDFVGELEFYTMQLMIDAADRKDETSILLLGSTKDRLLTLTSHMRDQVRKLDLPPSRIDQLIRRIDEFDGQLTNPRLSLMAVAVLSISIAGVIADLGTAGSIVRKLVSEVEQAVGMAKDEQEKEAASRLVTQEPVRQLQPARHPEQQSTPPDDLDDDIPF